MIWATLLKVAMFAKRIPTWAYVALGAVLVVLMAWAWHNSQVSQAASDGLQKGAQAQRETDLIETIDRTEQANETRETIKAEVRAGNGGALYDQCLRTARTPAHCQRFLSGGETPLR